MSAPPPAEPPPPAGPPQGGDPEPRDYYRTPPYPNDPQAPWGRNARGNSWYPRRSDGVGHVMTSPAFLACMAVFAVAVIIAVVIVLA